VHLFIALFLFLGCSESPQSKNVPSDSIILIDKILIRLENAKKEMKEESERLLNSEDAKQFQEIGKKFRTSDGNKSILSKSKIEFLGKMKKQNTRAHNIQQKYIEAIISAIALTKTIGEKCKTNLSQVDRCMELTFKKFPDKETEMWKLK